VIIISNLWLWYCGDILSGQDFDLLLLLFLFFLCYLFLFFLCNHVSFLVVIELWNHLLSI